MALFDFLFKRKKDEPQPAAEDRPSETRPPKKRRKARKPPNRLQNPPRLPNRCHKQILPKPTRQRANLSANAKPSCATSATPTAAACSAIRHRPARRRTRKTANPPLRPKAPAPTQEPETLSDGLHPENEAETAEEPAEQEPVEEKEQPSETQPTEEQPTEVRHTEEQPEQEPAAEKAQAVEDRPVEKQPAEEQPAETGGWTARLKQGLSKSRDKMAKSLPAYSAAAKSTKTCTKNSKPCCSPATWASKPPNT